MHIFLFAGWNFSAGDLWLMTVVLLAIVSIPVLIVIALVRDVTAVAKGGELKQYSLGRTILWLLLFAISFVGFPILPFLLILLWISRGSDWSRRKQIDVSTINSQTSATIPDQDSSSKIIVG